MLKRFSFTLALAIAIVAIGFYLVPAVQAGDERVGIHELDLTQFVDRKDIKEITTFISTGPSFANESLHTNMFFVNMESSILARAPGTQITKVSIKYSNDFVEDYRFVQDGDNITWISVNKRGIDEGVILPKPLSVSSAGVVLQRGAITPKASPAGMTTSEMLHQIRAAAKSVLFYPDSSDDGKLIALYALLLEEEDLECSPS